MEERVNIHDAKTRLSELVARAEKGEELTIARAGKPVARLVPIGAAPPRRFGVMDLSVPDSFFEPLPEDELASWE